MCLFLFQKFYDFYHVIYEVLILLLDSRLLIYNTFRNKRIGFSLISVGVKQITAKEIYSIYKKNAADN
jgi:hypothetical protein